MKPLKIAKNVMMIICFIISFIHPVSYAMMPGDIDGNNILNLKDCLQILNTIASDTNESAVKRIQGLPLIKGTYSQIKNAEKTTYTFNENGSCHRVGPDSLGGIMTTEGTWHYENESLYINTSGKLRVYAVIHDINIDEYYKAAFTNADASKLILAPPGKNLDQLPDILGRYAGAGKVDVTLPNFSFGNKIITIESIINVKSDGSWESVITINTNGIDVIDKFQGNVDPLRPILYVFGNSFYPDMFSSDTQKAYFERE